MLDNTFNQKDLKFIDQIRKGLSQVDAPVIKEPDTNTFKWVHRDYFIAQSPDGVDYKNEMIEAFIQDLENNTQTYHYNIYHWHQNLVNDLFEPLFDEFKGRCAVRNNGYSHYLRLRILETLKLHNEEFFQQLLKYSQLINDVPLTLDVLKIGNSYEKEVVLKNAYTATQLIYTYNKLLSLNSVSIDEIKENFVSHIKNSHIKISESNLIGLYASIFSHEDLDFIYDAFHIEKEQSIKKNDSQFSIMSISLKNLITTPLNYDIIIQINSLLFQQNIDFPKCYILDEKNDAIQIITENKEGNEKKVMMLYEQLIATNYDYMQDSKGQKLLNLVAQVNEVINLDNKISIKEEKKKQIKL
jgi:hypothetical protein